MKAESATQRKLLDLAEVDAELDRVAYQRRNLPELAEVTQAERALREQRDSLVAAQTSGSDLDTEVARQEREVESVRAREKRDSEMLESGSVSAKQLSELEHELETLRRRQQALEDDLLEVMERKEAVDLDIQRSSAAVEAAEQELGDAQRRRDEVLADLDATRARRDADRGELTQQLPADLLAEYDRIRGRKGTGAAMLRARRCGSCQLEVDRRTLAEIKSAAHDDVVHCENCEAILVRTAESGL